MIRLITETGALPIYDLSYGGFTKSFYVPAYRLFVSSLSLLSGADPMIASALATVMFSTIAIAAFYLLGRESANEWAGVCAAFLFVLSPEMTIYTIRAFPQVLGIPFMLLTLYALKKHDYTIVVLATVLTVLTHQTTAVVLGSTLLVYSVLARDKKAFFALLIGIAAYASWQMFSLNTLDVLSMRQIALKESGTVTLMNVERIGLFALVFAPFGFPRLVKQPKENLLLLSFLLATLVLSKNEMLGIGIFTDRLFTFFGMAVVLLAGIGMADLGEFLGMGKWK